MLAKEFVSEDRQQEFMNEAKVVFDITTKHYLSDKNFRYDYGEHKVASYEKDSESYLKHQKEVNEHVRKEIDKRKSRND